MIKRLVLLLVLAGGPACAQGTFPGTIAGPWTTYTPAPTCGTATITVNNARAQTVGKTTTVQIDMTITALGTCTNGLTFTLPNTANTGGGLSGRSPATGRGFTCSISGTTATAVCINSDSSNFATGQIIASGVYESQ